MNARWRERAVTPQNEARDKEIAIGIAATLMTLATQQGWGAKRLRRLNDQVYEFVQAGADTQGAAFQQELPCRLGIQF